MLITQTLVQLVIVLTSENIWKTYDAPIVKRTPTPIFCFLGSISDLSHGSGIKTVKISANIPKPACKK